MRNLIYVIALLLTINICAQERFENAKVFVRVYNFQGKKIVTGKIISISPTSLQLSSKRTSVELPVSSIGTIKTKHSAGNNILIGAAIGVVTGAIIGAATTTPVSAYSEFSEFFEYYSFSSKEEGALAGVVLGGIAGGGIGGITVLFKNSESYEINGDMLKWIAFTEMMTKELTN